ncbi:hypothetical protein V6Z12_A13G212000 [Gossypium hirsutum]
MGVVETQGNPTKLSALCLFLLHRPVLYMEAERNKSLRTKRPSLMEEDNNNFMLIHLLGRT